MKIENGKIVEATYVELFDFYLTREWDTVMPFPEYIRRCKKNGTKIIAKEGDQKMKQDKEAVLVQLCKRYTAAALEEADAKERYETAKAKRIELGDAVCKVGHELLCAEKKAEATEAPNPPAETPPPPKKDEPDVMSISFADLCPKHRQELDQCRDFYYGLCYANGSAEPPHSCPFTRGRTI